MSNWVREDFALRMGLGSDDVSPRIHEPRPAILAKADIDPATRGMMAVISTTMLDEFGGTGNIEIKYWYRRQNGQTSLIHLFDIKVNEVEDGEGVEVEEIYYRNKPLIGHLPPEWQIRPREILLDAVREINLHLREGGSPKEISKILHDYSIPEIVGEDIVLPGQNSEGQFNFKVTDLFNAAAQGKLSVTNDMGLPQALLQGEVNTLDAHRRIDANERKTFATNKTTGTTFRGVFSQERKPYSTDIGIALEPVMVAENDRSKAMQNFLRMNWKRNGADENYVMRAMKFLNQDTSAVDTDTQIKILGASYRIMDLFRRNRYPTALDILHEFDLLNLFSPIEPPPEEGRMSVISYLGNGKEEIVEGFGFDLGACKAVCFEKPDEQGNVKREIVLLDLGKMLAPQNSEWDGGLPDIIGILKDVKAIFITHRHLDHMASIIELARLGVLKDKLVLGAPRVLYILNNQLRAEVDDKSLLPEMEEIRGEGIRKFGNLEVEYCVDGMDHSTPSTIYRVVARTDANEIKGSYLFYGDGRQISKPEFLSRGLLSFGLDRQDTLHDLDLTNAKKPGHCPNETDAERNLIDLMKCLPNHGIMTGLISTNDRRLKTLYKVFNRLERNFTAVGHNVEMSLRAHNIHGVDPEYMAKKDKDNVNQFLEDDAKEITQARTASLQEELERATDADEIERLQDEIQLLTKLPVGFRSRGSQKAKSWLEGDLSKLAVLVTGTQGNPGEMFSTLYRFSEGWSTLDADRHTSYKISDPKKWAVVIDQSAIPGNHTHQRKMIDRLLRNRGVAHVFVAIDDGFKVFGMNDLQRNRFIKAYVTGDRKHYIDDDGSLVITGAPIHPSGHGYMEDIADIARTAKADWNHGTHTNDPENTTRFHIDICEKNGLRHVGRQFDDFEHNEIDMGKTPEEARVTSLGHSHSSMVLFKIVREFGKFFGGTLQAKRVTKLDGESGYAQYGLMGSNGVETFEHDVAAIDFASAARKREMSPDNKLMPDEAMMSLPLYERRYRGVQMPDGVRLDKRKCEQIRNIAARLVA